MKRITLFVAGLVCLVSVTFAGQPDKGDPNIVIGKPMKLPDGRRYLRTEGWELIPMTCEPQWADCEAVLEGYIAAGKSMPVRQDAVRKEIRLRSPFDVMEPQSGPLPFQNDSFLYDHLVTGTVGDKSIGILKVDFTNATAPYHLFELQAIVDELERSYIEYSGGAIRSVNLDDVFGPFQIQMSLETCEPFALASMAAQAAIAAGVNLNFYTDIIYNHPRSVLTPACNYAGLGSVGGSPSDTWWNGEASLRTVRHEFGHAGIGWFHSHALRCTGGVLTEPCTIVDLGNPTDIMGAAQAAHPNFWQKWHARWIATLGRPQAGVVDGSGFYEMGPFAAPGTKDVGVIVPIPESNYALGLEYRRPVPGTLDAELATWPGISNVVMINRGHLTDPNQIDLFDMHWQTPDLIDAGLGLAQLYADASAGVSMWPISLTDAGADMLIQRDSDQLVVQILPNQGGVYHTGDTYVITTQVTIDGRGAPAASLWTNLIYGGVPYAQPPLMAEDDGTAVMTGQITADMARGTYTFQTMAGWGRRKMASTMLNVEVQ